MSKNLLFKSLNYLLAENISNIQLSSFSRSLTSFQTSNPQVQNTKKRSFSLKNDKLSISQEEVHLKR